MATYLTNNYQAIDFSALKETNVFETFTAVLLNTGFELNTAIANNVNAPFTSTALGKSWTQTFTGNATNGTHTITSTDGAYSIKYVGSNIGTTDNGIYKLVEYRLPNILGNPVTVTIEGAIERFNSGNLGTGTINKISYELGTLKVELFGTMTKTIVIPPDGSSPYDTFTGSVTGFNFKDANGQLQITNISPALSLAGNFDDLTFNQLDGNAQSQLTQATESNFTSLFELLDTPTYKGGTDTIIADPGSSTTQGGEGSSSNPKTLKTLEDNFSLPEGSADYYANGNELNNVMTGNSARNFFKGFAGVDTLIGNAGDDTLDGGAGKDTLNGGTGNDTYILDTTVKGKYEDKLVEAKNAGSDTLAFRSAFGLVSKPITLKLVKNFENLDVSQTNTNYNLTGDAGNNVLTGNTVNNVLDGGKGADTLVGGGGADTYILDNAGDVVTEALDADIDTINVKFLSNYALIDNIENAVLGHTKALGLTGNALNNTLTGNSAANTINGADGDDTLNGGKGSGKDTLNGDAGNDTLNGGAGNDTLNGGIGNDVLRGEAGNDVLNGGAGNDTLSGGKGKDTFDFNDKGTAGNPSVDTITDFSIKEKDVLDLRDLLDLGSNNWADYINIALTNGKTEISVSSAGTVSTSEDAHITINADLFSLTKTGTEEALYNILVSKGNLLID